MDTLDRKIVSALSADSRTPTSALARKLGIARSTLQARLDRLQERGVIAGYTIRLGRDVLARRIRATVLVQIEPRATATVLQRLRGIPEVHAVHTTTGRFDMILQISAETTHALDAVLDQIGAIPGVRGSESLIHLSTKFDRTA